MNYPAVLHDEAGHSGRRAKATHAAHATRNLQLAVVSHEMRTLLYGMLASIELIGKTRLDAAQAQLSAAMACSAHTLKDILNNTLDFTRHETEAVRVARHEFDLSRVIESTVQAFEARAVIKGLQLHSQIDPALAGLWWGDSIKLMQILNNLLNNAVKFTERGGVTVKGELVRKSTVAGNGDVAAYADAYTDDHAEILLTVCDTGPGIAGEDIDGIFGLFSLARNVETPYLVSGAGLGLYICRQFATAMGGVIDLASSPPAGSTFTLRLTLQRSGRSDAGRNVGTILGAPVPAPVSISASPPASPEAGDAGNAADTHRARSAHIRRKSKPWVLVVDDQPINRLLLEKQLRHLGCQTATAANGADALADERRFDLILTDLQLPGLDGHALTRAWRAAGMICPIVAISAGQAAGERERCIASGMNGYLAKPFTMDELAQLLQRHFGMRTPHRVAHLADNGWHRWEPDAMHIVAASLSADLGELAVCVASADVVRLGQVVHRIHGGVALLEMRPAAALCRTIEECIEFEWLEESWQFVPALRRMLRQIRDDIAPDETENIAAE